MKSYDLLNDSQISRMKYIRNSLGFTAAEIITVVAIIAILALIVIPKFWSRTEEARIARAKEEMARIADAESLAFADTNFYVHMGNLHSVEQQTNAVVSTWNFDQWLVSQPIFPGEGTGYETRTLNSWKGPYITYQQTEVSELTSYSPLDPWKNPYIFFGPITITASDTTEGSKVRIWSAGPNLQLEPGSNYPWGPAAGDDILYVR